MASFHGGGKKSVEVKRGKSTTSRTSEGKEKKRKKKKKRGGPYREGTPWYKKHKTN